MNIYLITNLIDGKQYVGKKETDDPNYFCGGTYINCAIEKYGKENFKKEIIIPDEDIWDYEARVDRQEHLAALEIACIVGFDTHEEHGGYNLKLVDWPLPLEILKKGGRNAGKINGRKTFENKTGCFGMSEKRNFEVRSRAGKIAGRKTFENKTGIHGMTLEERVEVGRRNGKINGLKIFKDKIGIFGMSEEKQFEARSKGGKISGQKQFENKTGIFAPENLGKGGKVCRGKR